MAQEYPEAAVSLSSEVLPQFREFERSMATALNAAVMPHMSRYLSMLRGKLDGQQIGAPLLIMKSNGGVTSAETAARQAIHTALSGPAAGVIGAVSVAHSAGCSNIISIDVGGTSADICLVRDRQPEITKDAKIGPFPLKIPIIDINRYAHQSFELTCPMPDGDLTQPLLHQLVKAFHREHQRLYSYDLPRAPVELVNLRVTAIGLLPKLQAQNASASAADLQGALAGTRSVYFDHKGGFVETPCYTRSRLGPEMTFEGPAIVDQDDATTLIYPNFDTKVDPVGNLILTRRA